MAISIIINVNEDVIQIHNNEDVKLLSKDLINIFIEASLEHHLLFVSFTNPYPMVYTD